MDALRNLVEGFELRVVGWIAHHRAQCLRMGLGVVFLWFGALKLVPGASPAEALVRETVGWMVNPTWFLPVLALWEVTIGLGMLTGRFRRATLLLLFAHMPGTFMPLVVTPELVWTHFPFVLTLEGQYIVKNLVLIGSALVLFSKVPEGDARGVARPVLAWSRSGSPRRRIRSALTVERVSRVG
jgi:uncharacterized membrane protein YkgB